MLAANLPDGQHHKSTLLRLMEGLLQGATVLGGSGLLLMILLWTLEPPVSWEESQTEQNGMILVSPAPEPVYDLELNEDIHALLLPTRTSLVLRESRSGGLIREFPHLNWVQAHCVKWLPRTCRFLVGFRDGQVMLMDSRYSQTPLFSAKAHQYEVRSIAVSADGAIAATASDDCICLWDLNLLQIIEQIPAQAILPNVLQFSPDQTRLVVGCDDGSIRMFGRNDLNLKLHIKAHSTSIHTIRFIENGRKILSGDVGGEVRLWDAATGEVYWKLSDHAQILTIAVSPDERLMVFSDWRRGLRVYSLETFEKISSLEGHTRAASSLRFSTREPWLYSAGYDGTIRIWDIESFEEIAAFEGTLPSDD